MYERNNPKQKTISLRRSRPIAAQTHTNTGHVFQSTFFSWFQSIVPLWIATTITKGSPVVSTCSSHSLELLFSEINLHCFLQNGFARPKAHSPASSKCSSSTDAHTRSGHSQTTNVRKTFEMHIFWYEITVELHDHAISILFCLELSFLLLKLPHKTTFTHNEMA